MKLKPLPRCRGSAIQESLTKSKVSTNEDKQVKLPPCNQLLLPLAYFYQTNPKIPSRCAARYQQAREETL